MHVFLSAAAARSANIGTKTCLHSAGRGRAREGCWGALTGLHHRNMNHVCTHKQKCYFPPGSLLQSCIIYRSSVYCSSTFKFHCQIFWIQMYIWLNNRQIDTPAIHTAPPAGLVQDFRILLACCAPSTKEKNTLSSPFRLEKRHLL